MATTVCTSGAPGGWRQVFLASLGAIFVATFALGVPDMVGGLVPYLLEGSYTFKFRSLRATSVAAMFCTTITARTVILFLYKRWALRRGLLGVRLSLGRSAIKWLVMAGALAVLGVIVRRLLERGPYTHTLIAFVRYWGVWLGVTNTFLQYVYCVTEGVAIVVLTDAFQQAGESALPRLKLPWGGLALALLWGCGHYFTKGAATAAYAIGMAIIVGVLFQAGRKSFWPPFVMWMTSVLY